MFYAQANLKYLKARLFRALCNFPSFGRFVPWNVTFIVEIVDRLAQGHLSMAYLSS